MLDTIFHTNRGAEYTSHACIDACTKRGFAARGAAWARAWTAMILGPCPGRPDPCYDRPGALALTCRPVRGGVTRVLAGRTGGDLIGA